MNTLRTPEKVTRSAPCWAVVREPSSVSVDLMRPDWLNTHIPPAKIMRNVSLPCFNVEWRCCIISESSVSSPIKAGPIDIVAQISISTDVPDSRYPISVAAVDKPLSHAVTAVADKASACRNKMCNRKALKKTNNLHDNSGTLKYLVGQ